jgi:hypothetical protein
MLKPLVEALTGAGSGRQEVIADAHRRGAFRDFRLLGPALKAIDDGYGEIADFVADEILPLYGKAIYGDLKATFDPKGKGGAVRRLRVMHRLDPTATRELVEQVLESGSKELKLAALGCLQGSREAIPRLLEQAKAKSSEVRGVALRCLAEFDDDAVVDTLIAAISGEDLSLAAQPASRNPSPRLLKFLLAEAEKQLAGLFTAKGKEEAKKRPARFHGLLACFAQRRDKQTVAFLTRCFGQREEIGELKGDCPGHQINRRVASLLANSGSKPAQKLVVEAHATLPPEVLDVAMVAAVHSRKPREVYDLFAPYYLARIDGKGKERAAVAEKRECVEMLLMHWSVRCPEYRAKGFDVDMENASLAGSTIDPRWLDAAVQTKDLNVVLALARPGHKGTYEVLSDAVEAMLQKSGADYGVLETMIRIGHPKTVEHFVQILEHAGRAKHANYGYWFARLIADLPADAVPRIEALLPSLPENMVDHIVPYLAELQAKAAAAAPTKRR